MPQGGEGAKGVRSETPTPLLTAATRPTPSTTTLTEPERFATRGSRFITTCLTYFTSRSFAIHMTPHFLSGAWLGQKVATLPSATTAQVGGKHITGAHPHLQGDTRTHRAGKRTSRGTKPTSGSAAAPGAAAIHPHTPCPETEAPARPSPRTTNRTTPGETSPHITLSLSAPFWSVLPPYR